MSITIQVQTPTHESQPVMLVTVHRTYTIEFNGTPEQYINLAEQITPEGLANHDLGDATGAFLAAERLTHSGNLILTIDNATLRASFDDDLYEYQTDPEPKAP